MAADRLYYAIGSGDMNIAIFVQLAMSYPPTRFAFVQRVVLEVFSDFDNAGICC